MNNWGIKNTTTPAMGLSFLIHGKSDSEFDTSDGGFTGGGGFFGGPTVSYGGEEDSNGGDSQTSLTDTAR